MMIIASWCMGDRRCDWALAMQAEFQVVAHERAALPFAAGCVVAAVREMLSGADGRASLASLALALGLIVPLAGLQLAHIVAFITGDASHLPDGTILAGMATNPVLVWSQIKAVPALLLLSVSLGIGQMVLAWLLLDRNWQGIVKVGAAVCASTVTLLLFLNVLLLDVTGVIAWAGMFVVELALVAVVARLVPDSSPSAAFNQRN